VRLQTQELIEFPPRRKNPPYYLFPHKNPAKGAMEAIPELKTHGFMFVKLLDDPLR
jgi:hypothetical protein